MGAARQVIGVAQAAQGRPGWEEAALSTARRLIKAAADGAAAGLLYRDVHVALLQVRGCARLPRQRRSARARVAAARPDHGPALAAPPP